MLDEHQISPISYLRFPLLENMLPVVNLWKLPEGDVDSLSGTFSSFVVSGSQGGGGELPLGGGEAGRRAH